MRSVADVVDAALEFPVAPSFTKLGYHVRRRLERWTALDTYDLSGRTALVTGATSGLGLAIAERLVDTGASVIVLGRDQGRTERVRARLAARSTAAPVATAVADMGDLDAVRRVAAHLTEANSALDVVIHNAGALTPSRRVSPQGIEQTVASQVVGPFLLTGLLMDRLVAAGSGRVITMSSGGMYAASLTVDGLEMSESAYRGAEQYSRAKRAQVTLNEMWAERVGERGVVFHALHPGWADTPGVQEALPTFRRIVGPLLRSADEGADTAVWLAADDGDPLATNGAFWLDRRTRPIHRLPSTRRSDTPERRARLWDWCVATARHDPLV